MPRFLFALSAVAVMVGASGSAHANGRFPASNAVTFSKSNPDLILLRVTFGLLLSTDHGKNFDWVCEQAMGYSGVEDPMYVSTPSGIVLATTSKGLSLSSDKACSWTLLKQGLDQQVFVDLAANPADGKDILAFASSYARQDHAGNLHFASKLWETKDEGKTFAPLGDALDDSLVGHTIDFTATDPNRLYITAVRNPGPTGVGLLLTSVNHGATWTEQQIPLRGSERSLFIAAVDPHDAEKVYIRTNSNPDQPGRLLLREKAGDGGANVRTLFTSKVPLTGFALSPDGARVWIGSAFDGVYVANTTDYQFTQKSRIEAQCLADTADGLYACSNEKSGFILGLSKDDGATFAPVLHFCGVRGPLACGEADASTQQCAPSWAAQQRQLGCSNDTAVDGGPAAGGGPPKAKRQASCTCDVVAPVRGRDTAGGAAVTLLAAAALIRRSRMTKRVAPY